MVTNLGAFFPPEYQKAHRERNLRPGAVFKIFAKNTNPPKIKRIVVLGINEEKTLIGHLFINSNINLQCLDTDDLRNLQIYLEASYREYLDHNSYLDCSDLKPLPIAELERIYNADPSILLGHLSAEELAEARAKAAIAKTIRPKYKRMFGLIS